MIPIHQLLSRIQWDEAFGDAHFEVAYHDRVGDRLIRVAFEKLELEQGNRFDFALTGPEGEPVRIPFHRVREVYRDGARIWNRPGADHGL